jgi:hypothetical protein
MQRRRRTKTDLKTQTTAVEVWEPDIVHVARAVLKLHEAIASKPAQQDAGQGHKLEHELRYKAEKYESLTAKTPITPDLVVTLLTATDVMADVAKITTLDKATLHRPMRIPKYGTRLDLDADIRQHVAQEARRLAAEAAAAKQERLKAKSSPPLQQRDPAQAKATQPAKCARADAGNSRHTKPSKKSRTSKATTDARRQDSSSKSSNEASQQPASKLRPPAPARTETVQQTTRPAESAVGRSDKKAQNKPDKNAKTALTPAASGSGNIPKGKSSSNSSGKMHQTASTAPPTTATAATSQSAQDEPPTPDKSTESKATTSTSNKVTTLPRVPKKTS